MSEWFASKDISEQCEEAFEDESPDKNSSATKETIANSLDILEQKKGCRLPILFSALRCIHKARVIYNSFEREV